MKVLIAVIGCERRKLNMDVQRQTWVEAAKDRFDARFFLAIQDREPLPDEVFLDVNDDYQSLPSKVKGMCSWADNQGYDHVMKTDDDTVIWPERLVVPSGDYVGRKSSGGQNWCRGMSYWLSQKSVQSIARAPLTDQTCEDRWVGKVLLSQGIISQFDTGIRMLKKRASGECLPHKLSFDKNVYVAGEFFPEEMENVYAENKEEYVATASSTCD